MQSQSDIQIIGQTQVSPTHQPGLFTGSEACVCLGNKDNIMIITIKIAIEITFAFFMLPPMSQT